MSIVKNMILSQVIFLPLFFIFFLLIASFFSKSGA